MKTVIAPAGERTKILHIVSDSIPQTVRFAASDDATGGPASGIVEVVRRRWFVPEPPERAPLQAENTFRKGFADASYAIYVTPERDARIVFRSWHFERHVLYTLLASLAVFGLLSALLVPLLLS